MGSRPRKAARWKGRPCCVQCRRRRPQLQSNTLLCRRHVSGYAPFDVRAHVLDLLRWKQVVMRRLVDFYEGCAFVVPGERVLVIFVT